MLGVLLHALLGLGQFFLEGVFHPVLDDLEPGLDSELALHCLVELDDLAVRGDHRLDLEGVVLLGASLHHGLVVCDHLQLLDALEALLDVLVDPLGVFGVA